jgi:hypothetical protein
MIKMGNKEILVCLKYKGSDFFGRKELFTRGTIVWAGHEILNFIGESEPEWDEIIFVRFAEEESYNKSIEQLADEQRLSYYKALLVRNYPQEVIDRVNKMSYRDTSVDTTRVDLSELNHDDANLNIESTQEKFDLLLQRDQNKPIVMLNIVKYRDIAKYPESYNGKKNISGKDAYKLYGLNSAKVQGMPMVNVTMDLAGENLATIVVNNEPDWDHYFFARYPSNEHFLAMTTSVVYREGVFHRRAALEKALLYAVSPYDEF